MPTFIERHEPACRPLVRRPAAATLADRGSSAASRRRAGICATRPISEMNQ